MGLNDYLKPLLRENVNIEDVVEKINSVTAISSDKVKDWISKPENKPTFDSIVGKAITTHIEKEKTARAEWEKQKAGELLEEAKQKIAIENQKSPEMLQIEELQRQLQEKDTKERVSTLKSALLDIVKKDKLPVSGVDPFLNYGENAEAELRKFSDSTQALIDEQVQKQLNDKFGGGKMPGGGENKNDDEPVSTKDYLQSVGITT